MKKNKMSGGMEHTWVKKKVVRKAEGNRLSVIPGAG
jgi:hypothetical protein